MRTGMKRRLLRKMIDSTAIDRLTWILASVEHELLSAAVDLEAAHDLDGLAESDLPTVEQRQDALKELVGALADDSIGEVWIEQVAPSILTNPEKAEEYLGMDGDEWTDQMKRWADTYREGGAAGSDRALAEHHVREQFDVDLETFEQRVVEFDAGSEAEHLFAGNLRAVRESMDRATEATEGEE